MMISKNIFLILSMLSLTMAGCDGPVPTRAEIAEKYPDVEQGSARPENTRVLCPFVRMLERAGLFDDEVGSQPTRTVMVKSVASAARKFGCATLGCGAIASLVSVGQNSPGVDIERLHAAFAISHDCGLTFGSGETEVNQSVRQATLDRLADGGGNLVFQDIETVKLETCAGQGVEVTRAGKLEMKLIFAYLGGVENGSVPLSDVERLLNATMPEAKTTSWVDAALLGSIQ